MRRCVRLDATALEAVAEAFSWLADDRATMPPIQHVSVAEHRGDIDIKTAYVRGLDQFAVKIAAGFYDNPKLGLPSGSGMMVVLDARTGFARAVLLDNGYLTDLRTALAGAVAARHLAPRSTSVVGVIGTGAQARLQILSLQLVCPFERLLVWGRDRAKAAAYASEMVPQLDRSKVHSPEVEVVATAEELVRRSQCVVTTTPARAPLIAAEWLHPGLHITAMGSDGPGKQELDPALLEAADLVVCDRREQSVSAGEMQHLLAPEDLAAVELGELTLGRHPGRASDEQVTVCDLSGTGVQDTAIALLALEQAQRQGLGLTLPN